MKSYAVDRDKWQKLSLFEQMGNIGSEVGRTYSAASRGDQAASKAAMTRALDLFDATTSNNELSPARRKEILRAKEEYLRAFFDNTDRPWIENYFMQFSIAARLHR